ncbi:MAG: helix-turn-helix domain-containing protein, partial [Muribaculaceae bacterium]
MVNKEYYSIDEVAEKLSVSVKSVRRLVASGELESIRVSNLYRISQCAFDDFVRKNSSNAKKQIAINYNLFGEPIEEKPKKYTPKAPNLVDISSFWAHPTKSKMT